MQPFEDEEQQIVEQPSIRDLLEQNIDAAEASDDGAPTADSGRARDDQGRFAAKEEAAAPAPAPAPTAAPAPAPVVEAAAAAPTPTPAPANTLTTWRREFVPLQNKLAAGEALSPDEARKLAEYNVQREREYSTGISSYKAEVEAAKPVMGVLQEFIPALQGAGMAPEAWIQNMGRTHAALVFGSPEQKLNVITQVMQGYGITPQALVGFLQGQPDQAAMQAMHQAHAGSQQQHQLQQMQFRAQQAEQQLQQQQQQEIQQQLSKFSDASQYPYFEQVRGEMAQLLEAGSAQDLDSAYAKAVRLNDEIFAADQQRQAAENAAKTKENKVAAASKARQAGGSVRSGGAAVAPPPAPVDIRTGLESAWDEHAGAGRV